MTLKPRSSSSFPPLRRRELVLRLELETFASSHQKDDKEKDRSLLLLARRRKRRRLRVHDDGKDEALLCVVKVVDVIIFLILLVILLSVMPFRVKFREKTSSDFSYERTTLRVYLKQQRSHSFRW